jgi:prephenate dehydratase
MKTSDKNVLHIAYLGPSGTFSEEAVHKYLNGGRAKLTACTTMEEICRGIKDCRWDEGMLPVENSTEGAVGEAMDLLAAADLDLTIRGEVLLPIRHCLLAPPGVTIEQIELVASHPQAIGQCRVYLERNLSGVNVLEMASTAHAAREIAREKRPWAVIASAAAAVYGLDILARDISDCKENITRFLILGREEAGNAKESKTTIVLTLSDRPGALHSILGEFAGRGINLTRIESRPSKRRLGEYIFFVDFSGHKNHPEIIETLEKVKEKCISCRVAGSYPAATATAHDYLPVQSLDDLRRKINVVDREILYLLARRMTLSDQAARFKDINKIRDSIREKEILNRLMEEAADRGLDPIFVNTLFKIILDHSVARQREITSGRFGASFCTRE